MNEAREIVFSHADIMRMLPHRYPFLLVDRVIEFIPKDRIAATKNVTVNEAFFAGHFPQEMVMPGVLILEGMAQTAALLLKNSVYPDDPHKAILLVGADEFRWKRKVVPGDVVRFDVRYTRSRQNLWFVEGEASVEGKIVASGKLSAMVTEFTPPKE